MTATVFQFRAATSEEAVTCCECGVEFASVVIIRRRVDGKLFWCPNGHSQVFTETEASKLRKQLEAEKKRREQAESDAQWAKANAHNASVAERKAKNKLALLAKRVNAGVCPHCQRTFKQLAAHMKCKHPEVQP